MSAMPPALQCVVDFNNEYKYLAVVVVDLYNQYEVLDINKSDMPRSTIGVAFPRPDETT